MLGGSDKLSVISNLEDRSSSERLAARSAGRTEFLAGQSCLLCIAKGHSLLTHMWELREKVLAVAGLRCERWGRKGVWMRSQERDVQQVGWNGMLWRLSNNLTWGDNT